MVDSQQIRDEFAARLKTALDNKPEVRQSRGRNVDLQAALDRAGVTTTTQATSKWLRGETMPEKDNMLSLAEWLGVRVEWLEYGRGQPLEMTPTTAKTDLQVSETLDALYALRGRVTPRSRNALDSIERAANEGRLTEDDVLLLERIAQRFETTKQSD